MEPEVATDIAPAEQDERTRNRLIRAGVTVFDRKGYAAASVREIVEIAGVTKPALYYHFDSKEGLLVAILETAARNFGDVMARAEARPGTARERLVALCEDVVGLFKEHVSVVRVAHVVFFGPAEGLPKFDCTVFERILREPLQRIVEDGQAAGEIRAGPARQVALALMGLVSTLTERHLHPDLATVDRDDLRGILTLLFDGVMTEARQQGEPRS